jgi:hypothetical protein
MTTDFTDVTVKTGVKHITPDVTTHETYDVTTHETDDATAHRTDDIMTHENPDVTTHETHDVTTNDTDDVSIMYVNPDECFKQSLVLNVSDSTGRGGVVHILVSRTLGKFDRCYFSLHAPPPRHLPAGPPVCVRLLPPPLRADHRRQGLRARRAQVIIIIINNSRFDTRCISSGMRIQSAVKCHC